MKGFVNLTHTNNKKIEDLRKLVEKKQDATPSDNIPIINEETGKIDNVYIPTNISGGRKFAGTFGDDGIIRASVYAIEVEGLNINQIDLATSVGYEFIYTGQEAFTLYNVHSIGEILEPAVIVYNNDVVVCNGAIKPSWTLFDNSDKVVSVNGMTGAVELNFATIDDINNAINGMWEEGY